MGMVVCGDRRGSGGIDSAHGRDIEEKGKEGRRGTVPGPATFVLPWSLFPGCAGLPSFILLGGVQFISIAAFVSISSGRRSELEQGPHVRRRTVPAAVHFAFTSTALSRDLAVDNVASNRRPACGSPEPCGTGVGGRAAVSAAFLLHGGGYPEPEPEGAAPGFPKYRNAGGRYGSGTGTGIFTLRITGPDGYDITAFISNTAAAIGPDR